jgi:hypothetical protein
MLQCMGETVSQFGVAKIGAKVFSDKGFVSGETLKGADHELEVQPVVLQIAALRLDMPKRHAPVELEF